jgi:hypothetical protein
VIGLADSDDEPRMNEAMMIRSMLIRFKSILSRRLGDSCDIEKRQMIRQSNNELLLIRSWDNVESINISALFRSVAHDHACS